MQTASHGPSDSPGSTACTARPRPGTDCCSRRRRPTSRPQSPIPARVARLSVERALAAVALVRRIDDRNLHVRVFAPASGIAEDPGTGAAAGPIGVLARRELGTDVDVTIQQGDLIGRPCTIEVHAEDGAIRVGGAVAACAEGRFTL